MALKEVWPQQEKGLVNFKSGEKKSFELNHRKRNDFLKINRT